MSTRQTLAPDYRAADIMEAVEKHGWLVMRFYPSYIENENPNLHRILALVGEIGFLQQLWPEKFKDSAKWTDIFSDIRLYQSAAVEILPTTGR